MLRGTAVLDLNQSFQPHGGSAEPQLLKIHGKMDSSLLPASCPLIETAFILLSNFSLFFLLNTPIFEDELEGQTKKHREGAFSPNLYITW